MIHRTEWEPGCAAGMRTVNKLIKYEVIRKVPTYTWKVEYCCDGCRNKLALEESAGVPGAMPTSGRTEQATSGRASGGVEPVSYQSADTEAKRGLPWDKMFK